jgi:hypothetical protein
MRNGALCPTISTAPVLAITSLVATSPGLSSSPSPLPIPTERRSLQCEVLLHISEYDFPGVDRWMLFSQESTRMVKNLKRIEKTWFPVSSSFRPLQPPPQGRHVLLSETSRACTIRVRRSSTGRLWNELGSHACVHHRNRRLGTSTEERISGRREPDPESPNQRQVVVIRCRKSYVG